MTEPKRRGRPPKTEQASQPEETVAAFTQATGIVNPASTPLSESFKNNAAQAYALRVWNGQTPTIPRNERLRRVEAALQGQGMTMEGVVLP